MPPHSPGFDWILSSLGVVLVRVSCKQFTSSDVRAPTDVSFSHYCVISFRFGAKSSANAAYVLSDVWLRSITWISLLDDTRNFCRGRQRNPFIISLGQLVTQAFPATSSFRWSIGDVYLVGVSYKRLTSSDVMAVLSFSQDCIMISFCLRLRLGAKLNVPYFFGEVWPISMLQLAELDRVIAEMLFPVMRVVSCSLAEVAVRNYEEVEIVYGRWALGGLRELMNVEALSSHIFSFFRSWIRVIPSLFICHDAFFPFRVSMVLMSVASVNLFTERIPSVICLLLSQLHVVNTVLAPLALLVVIFP